MKVAGLKHVRSVNRFIHYLWSLFFSSLFQRGYKPFHAFVLWSSGTGFWRKTGEPVTSYHNDYGTWSDWSRHMADLPKKTGTVRSVNS